MLSLGRLGNNRIKAEFFLTEEKKNGNVGSYYYKGIKLTQIRYVLYDDALYTRIDELPIKMEARNIVKRFYLTGMAQQNGPTLCEHNLITVCLSFQGSKIYIVNFPNLNVNNYMEKSFTQSLTAATACLWAKINSASSTDIALFSYSAGPSGLALEITNLGEMRISVNGNKR